jgi:hypothetical protein
VPQWPFEHYLHTYTCLEQFPSGQIASWSYQKTLSAIAQEKKRITCLQSWCYMVYFDTVFSHGDGSDATSMTRSRL